MEEIQKNDNDEQKVEKNEVNTEEINENKKKADKLTALAVLLIFVLPPVFIVSAVIIPGTIFFDLFIRLYFGSRLAGLILLIYVSIRFPKHKGSKSALAIFLIFIVCLIVGIGQILVYFFTNLPG